MLNDGDNQFWKKLIEEALQNKAEYNFLDFKLSASEKNERLKEHINAFGNLERGGCFVFGVEKFVPVGVKEDWDRITQRITHLAETTQEPALNVNVFPVEIDDTKLLCMHILSGREKPVFIKSRSPLGGEACFKRSGSSTIATSIQEIKDLLANSTEQYYDESPVKDASVDELDFDRLFTLLPQLDKNKRNSPKNIALLLDRRILIGTNNSPHITTAGWLCFATQPQHKRQFRNAYVEFHVFYGTMRDKPIKKHSIQGSLPEQIEQTIQLLQQNIWAIPKIQGVKREDILAYPEVVLREVITNSIVHRDYRKMHLPVKVAMFSNRVEISNPGGLMPGLTTLNLVHRRDWRNPLLAELMKKFGFGDMDGQGIDRLYAETLSIRVPPPVFLDDQNSFTVTLSAPKTFEAFTPEEKRLMIIILAIMQDNIDNESVRNCFGVSREKATTLIQAMTSGHILEKSSTSRKYAKYILTAAYRERIFG